MFLRIEVLGPTLVAGLHLPMSFAQNRTAELWGGFMPRRHELLNARANDLFSMQVFLDDFDFTNFDPQKTFEKWAAVAISPQSRIPGGMESISIPEGPYAVFLHKGPASEGAKTFAYIFGQWLPKSGYAVDNRPHFEILGIKYKHGETDSEEEIWIPVKKM